MYVSQRTLCELAERLGNPLLDGIFHFVLPAWCLACGARLPWRTPALSLCDACRPLLVDVPAGCPLCGAVLPERPEAWLCVACSGRAPAFSALKAAWSYQPPASQVVLALKFRGLDFLAGDIADALADRHSEALREHAVVTEVPLHWRRRWSRHYDQASLLASALAAHLDLPHRRLLKRPRATTPQTSLGGHARRRNIEGAFASCHSLERRPPRTVVLVDDVATTGATLDAAARELKRAGVEKVTAVVAALTPKRPPIEPIVVSAGTLTGRDKTADATDP
jgi:ComF family protein